MISHIAHEAGGVVSEHIGAPVSAVARLRLTALRTRVLKNLFPKVGGTVQLFIAHICKFNSLASRQATS